MTKSRQVGCGWESEPAAVPRSAEGALFRTPANPDGEANLAAVEHAAGDGARYADGGVMAGKSTVPALATDRIGATFQHDRADAGLPLVRKQRLLRKQTANSNALGADRLLVEADNAGAFDARRRLYAPPLERDKRLIETNVTATELSKHAPNAFLMLKSLLLTNPLARLSDPVGGDGFAATGVMASDPRIGPGFLCARLGYGGNFYPKEVAAFGRLAERLGSMLPIQAKVAWEHNGTLQAESDVVRLSPAFAFASRLLETVDVAA